MGDVPEGKVEIDPSSTGKTPGPFEVAFDRNWGWMVNSTTAVMRVMGGKGEPARFRPASIAYRLRSRGDAEDLARGLALLAAWRDGRSAGEALSGRLLDLVRRMARNYGKDAVAMDRAEWQREAEAVLAELGSSSAPSEVNTPEARGGSPARGRDRP